MIGTDDTTADLICHKRINMRFEREYAFYLERELDDFVQPDGGESSLLRHAVQVIAAPAATVVTVEFVRRNRFEGWLKTAASLGFTIFREENGRAIAHQYSEQIVLNRELGVHLHQREEEEMVLQICHPSDPRYWTNFQAWQDSNDAISLILAERGTISVNYRQG